MEDRDTAGGKQWVPGTIGQMIVDLEDCRAMHRDKFKPPAHLKEQSMYEWLPQEIVECWESHRDLIEAMKEIL